MGPQTHNKWAPNTSRVPLCGPLAYRSNRSANGMCGPCLTTKGPTSQAPCGNVLWPTPDGNACKGFGATADPTWGLPQPVWSCFGPFWALCWATCGPTPRNQAHPSRPAARVPTQEPAAQGHAPPLVTPTLMTVHNRAPWLALATRSAPCRAGMGSPRLALGNRPSRVTQVTAPPARKGAYPLLPGLQALQTVQGAARPQLGPSAASLPRSRLLDCHQGTRRISMGPKAQRQGLLCGLQRLHSGAFHPSQQPKRTPRPLFWTIWCPVCPVLGLFGHKRWHSMSGPHLKIGHSSCNPKGAVPGSHSQLAVCFPLGLGCGLGTLHHCLCTCVLMSYCQIYDWEWVVKVYTLAGTSCCTAPKVLLGRHVACLPALWLVMRPMVNTRTVAVAVAVGWCGGSWVRAEGVLERG